MSYICPKCGEPENHHYNLDYMKPERPVIDIICNSCGTTFKNPYPTLRNISYGELHQMMTRLAIDVVENPNQYLPQGKGIEEFIRGEHRRRDLFIQENKQ